jgi:DNA-3-methyladenine glycosylase I
MQDKKIIRNKMKIEAAINNAQAIVKLEKKGISFANFLKQYVPEIIVDHPKTMHDVPAKSTLSEHLAKGMKKAGFKFVGPVTIYSFLQAVGLINDHLDSCSFK